MAAANPAKPGSGSVPGGPVDPFLAFNFKLNIAGITEAHFLECSGLGVRIEPSSYIEAGNPVERWLPGRAHFDPVILKYGFTESREIWDWVTTVISPKPLLQKKDVQIIVLDADGVTNKVQWTLQNALPSAWRADPMATHRSGAAIHHLELVYENLLWQ
jgi:phage tail-like protein